ncbi:MAG: hypothetical protein ACO1Q7_16325 [Gemmatimonas sp.]
MTPGNVRRLIFAVCAAGAVTPSVALACRKTPFTVQRFTSSTVNVIGTPTSDTVRAGPGDVRHVPPDVARGPSTRDVYGQTVKVERIADYTRTMLPEGVREVVIVAWAYSSTCQPVISMGSARWLRTGMRGVYTAELRARSHWVNGVPVLDVFSPEFVPVRSGNPNRPNGDAPELSADELLDVASRLPDPDEVRQNPERASRSFLQWAQANPQLTRRLPAAGVVHDLVYEVRDATRRRAHVDIAGTWRFTASVEGEPAREFYARTSAVAGSEWYGDPKVAVVVRGDRDPWDVAPIRGLVVSAALSPSLAKLPTGCGGAGSRGYLNQRVIGVGGSTPDRIGGEIELELVNRALAGDTGFRAYVAVQPRTPADSAMLVSERVARGLRGDGEVEFVTGADGVMRVGQVWGLRERRVLVVRGERVSGETGKCAW